jgi:hypothetical protein
MMGFVRFPMNALADPKAFQGTTPEDFLAAALIRRSAGDTLVSDQPRLLEKFDQASREEKRRMLGRFWDAWKPQQQRWEKAVGEQKHTK